MAIDSERTAEDTRRQEAMQQAGLVVLLDRAGGKATYTEEEYQAIARQYGGTTSLAIHLEVVRQIGGPPRVELTLIRKTPENAELVS